MSKVQETVVLEEEEEEEDSCWTGEDEDNGDPKICRACGDRATGYHFNAMTCEGCKGFFRRAMKRNLRLSCPFQNSCVISKSNRRHCQACRLKKCLDIGMRREMIMSDAAVERRRALIKRKHKLTQSPPTPPGASLTPEQEHIVTELVGAHTKTFDFNFTFSKNFRPIRRSSDPTQEPQAASSEAFLMLPHISDLVTYMIKGVISFAKMLPYFKSLDIEDQIALLKGSVAEVCVIRFNTVFNSDANTWECGPFTYDSEDMFLAGFRQLFLEPLIRIHRMMRKLNLQSEEYAMMAALSIFSSDRPGVCDWEKIQKLQEHIALTLKDFIDSQRPPSQQNRLLYPKIMECLTELRTVNDIHSKQLLEIWDIQPDATPLMLEVFGSPE